MQRRMIWVYCTFLLSLVFCSSIVESANAQVASKQQLLQDQRQSALLDFPSVDPDYIYNQLEYMATHFQQREAGYENSANQRTNGHSAFANYWSQTMAHNLQGFGAQVLQDSFSLIGWRGRPASSSAMNVEVSVPGASHPEQAVIIGCHYDGMAFSTQSANDDASGCAIELGVAKALSSYWSSHHVYPARTLRFVIFDAEEQGLFGSFHYLNSTINGDTHNITAMFNEEQSGIAYPLRYLGQSNNPQLPLYIDVTPTQNNPLYPDQNKLSPDQLSNIATFHTLLQKAIPAVFQQFQALGYRALSYHDANQRDSFQPIFTPTQLNAVKLEDDTLGSSDQVPFTLAGLPCATFAGNTTFYDNNPPAWSYPYDQPQDTIQLMNTFADGSSAMSHALTLALAIPGMLTTWMLNQPAILGQSAVPSSGAPIAAISDIGEPLAGQELTLNANASFDPHNSQLPLSYSWDFGDGGHASGVEVHHIYTTPGNYTLALTTTSATSTSQQSKTIAVVKKATTYNNIYSQYQSDGMPQANPQVTLPQPNPGLADSIHQIASPPSSTHMPSLLSPLKSPNLYVFLSILLFLVALGLTSPLLVAFFRRRRRT